MLVADAKDNLSGGTISYSDTSLVEYLGLQRGDDHTPCFQASSSTGMGVSIVGSSVNNDRWSLPAATYLSRR